MSIQSVSVPRWEATIIYKTDNGPIELVHDFSELSELHALVERGPAWWTIYNINIKFVGHVDPQVYSGTVEEAETFVASRRRCSRR